MIRVKTFTSELRIFKTMTELTDLDEQVNRFLSENDITSVISVSDTCTSDEGGATMGLIRVLTYQTAQ
jgi:hypothetical protein